MADKAIVSIHLQNIYGEGCVQNVKVALGLIEGVHAIHVDRDAKIAHISYEPPATPLAIREQLLSAGYLSEEKTGSGENIVMTK
jgi:copper chaperone CopZ